MAMFCFVTGGSPTHALQDAPSSFLLGPSNMTLDNANCLLEGKGPQESLVKKEKLYKHNMLWET